jgi:hypothetical protein
MALAILRASAVEATLCGKGKCILWEETMTVLKNRVRAELFKCAIEGKFPTYTEFYNRIYPGKKMGQFPYRTHFNNIAQEERGNGYPDITFIVRGADGLPHQIDFDGAEKPSPAQIDSLRKGTDALIEMYCPPNTKNPYR